jgi:thioredoxin 1
MLNDVTDLNFDAEVLKSAQPILIDFWAPWCGPCRMVEPVLKKLSEKYQGQVKFCRMNVDENPKTPAQYRVMSIPNILFMKNGKVLDTHIGSAPEAVLVPKVDALIQAK